ncbi:metallophosphoesterase [Bdellovibrio sp. HCB209]|uniref:metallophosphoesterase n=1 Tax=Bdellovibrio sp. HCB209 TaxID=3394354 RepID=UPI0039B47C6B
MVYFISDFHFGHTKVIEYGERPFTSLEEMNDKMAADYNSVVTPEDTVYIVGDLSLGGIERAKEYLSKLNGKKILIRGNHDRGSKEDLLNAGYEEVHDTLILKHDGITIGLSHYPFRPPGEMPGKYDLKPDQCDFLIHGHLHQIQKEKIHESGKLMVNVSVEVLNYLPISLDEVVKIYRSTI